MERALLIAYLDEFGHVGPYIDTTHRKFFHNPIFGYAGIVLPAENVRSFGAKFERIKERQFRSEIVESGKHPRRWEKKGAEIFTTGSMSRYPERVDFIDDLADYMTKLGGRAFYYGERKPVGSKAETGVDAAQTTTNVLNQVVRQLCEYADSKDRQLLVFLDQGGPMPREDAISSMASFIYSGHAATKRIIEVPMPIESHRYGAMQYADWLCAILSRTVHFHFTKSDEFAWAPAVFKRVLARRATRKSRIWLPETKKPVEARALEVDRRWIDAKPPRPRHGQPLTHTIADAIAASR